MSDLRTSLPDAFRPAYIADDLFCIGCDYNLRSLQADGNCPECGRPVAASTEFLFEPRRGVARAVRSCGAAFWMWAVGWTVAITTYTGMRWESAVPLLLGLWVDAAAKWWMALAGRRLERDCDPRGAGGLAERLDGLWPTALSAAVAFGIGCLCPHGAGLWYSPGQRNLTEMLVAMVGPGLLILGTLLAIGNALIFRSVSMDLAARIGRGDLVRAQRQILGAWILGGVVLAVTALVMAPWDLQAARLLLPVGLGLLLPAAVMQALAATRLAAALDARARERESTA